MSRTHGRRLDPCPDGAATHGRQGAGLRMWEPLTEPLRLRCGRSSVSDLRTYGRSSRVPSYEG